MGRCSTLAGVDLTRRPQALGWLQLIFGLPAHLHVLCSIWAFLIRPKKTHKSGGANVVRLLSSSTQPQSSEVIDRLPQPSAWHDAWELSLNLSQHPYLLSPLRLFSFLPSINQISECQGSDVLAPHHPSRYEHVVSISWPFITHLWIFQDPNSAPAFPHSTNH